MDENPIEAILRKAYVLPQKLYISEGGEQCDDVFYCRESFSAPDCKFREMSEEWSRKDNFSRMLEDLAQRRMQMSYQEPKIGPEHQARPISPRPSRVRKVMASASHRHS